MATVSFSVNTESATESRAISDGSGANKLYYRAFRYEGDNNEWVSAISELESVDNFVSGQTVTLQLPKNQDVVVAFFAKNSEADCYNVTEDGTGMDVEISYDGYGNNDETRDAFFGNVSFGTAGNETKTVTLKRPFAQINVGTSDYAAFAAHYNCNSSGVTIKNAANKLNLIDGSVSGDVEVKFTTAQGDLFKEREGGSAYYPSEKLTVNGTDYTWLSMCYVLPQEKEQSTTVSAEFTFLNDKQPITLKNGLENMPIQRNYRTNVIGNILTGNVDFTVEIDANFEKPDENVSLWNGETSNSLTKDANGYFRIKSAADFAYFMTTCQSGNSVYAGKTIVLDTDINCANKTITGIGHQNCNFSGTFDGNGHTISNFVINSTNDYYAGLFQQVSHGATIKNLTVKNATVTGNKLVGVIASSLNEKSTIENCHVENCTVVAKVNKVGAITGYIAENSTVKGCSVKNTNIYCADADKNQSDKIIGYVDGSNTVENNTASDDVTVNRNVIAVSTVKELSNVGSYNGTVNNVVTSKNIILTNDIDCSGVQLNPIRLDGTCTFDGCGHTLKNVTVGEIGGRRALFNGEVIPGANVIIKNLNIDKVTVSKANAGVGDQYAAVLYGDMQNGLTLNIENVHINNAIVKNHNTVGGFVGFISNAGSNSLSIKNSSIKNSTIIGKEEVGKVGALVGRALGNGYTCSGVEIHNVVLYFNDQLLETVAHGAKSSNGCNGGYTIK